MEQPEKTSNLQVRIPERRTGKKWEKGVSANPAGKKKGTKNKLTLYREAVLMKQEKYLLQNLPQLLEVVMDKALGGDLQAAKLILERVIAAKKVAEEQEEKGNREINIIIQGATSSATLGNRVINADFERINEDSDEEEMSEAEFEEMDKEA